MLAVLPDARPAEGGRPTARLGEVPEPGCSSGEVLVRVRATAINRADLLQLRGLYPPPPGESDVPGLECAGTIERVGDGVEGWSPGDRVMALLGGGGHGERVAVPVGQLMALPDGMSFEQGAALPESCLTAWTNLVVEGGLDPEGFGRPGGRKATEAESRARGRRSSSPAPTAASGHSPSRSPPSSAPASWPPDGASTGWSRSAPSAPTPCWSTETAWAPTRAT